MRKEISKKELFGLITNIDYTDPKTYPIRFSVKNGKDIMYYESGIGEGLLDGYIAEPQYLIDVDNSAFINEGIYDKNEILDYQDPDDMEYADIFEMITDKCDLNEDSVITLYEDISFNGTKIVIIQE